MSLERINNYLARDFGYFESSDKPIYRLVWSDIEMEYRRTNFTTEGLELPYEIITLKRKYPYIDNKFVLERCLGIPSFVKTDLVNKFSYEPIYAFAIGKGDEYEFDTFYGAIKFIIDQVHEAAKRSFYKSNYEKDKTPEELKEDRKLQIKKMAQFLYPDESDVADALHWNEGIAVPKNFEANGTSQIIKES